MKLYNNDFQTCKKLLTMQFDKVGKMTDHFVEKLIARLKTAKPVSVTS